MQIFLLLKSIEIIFYHQRTARYAVNLQFWPEDFQIQPGATIKFLKAGAFLTIFKGFTTS